MGFHTDGEDKTTPNAGSFLYARIVPPEGGDTLFADMYAAYAALPDDIRQKIAGRRALFSRADMHKINYPNMRPYTAEELAARPDVYHPLVRRHPRTGRVSLYVGRWACDIEGLPADEGRAIVGFLQEFARPDRFVYRHHWRDGDAGFVGQPLHPALRDPVRRGALYAAHAPYDPRGRYADHGLISGRKIADA
jgi:alpha-ketoglutarate-dependent taurine dioxygenase